MQVSSELDTSPGILGISDEVRIGQEVEINPSERQQIIREVLQRGWGVMLVREVCGSKEMLALNDCDDDGFLVTLYCQGEHGGKEINFSYSNDFEPVDPIVKRQVPHRIFASKDLNADFLLKSIHDGEFVVLRRLG